MSILFKNCKLLLRSENADGSPAYRAEDGFLGVEGKTIDYIGTQRPEKQYGEEKDMAGNLLMPGLANAHGHAAMTLVRGVGSDLSLQDWLSMDEKLRLPDQHAERGVAQREGYRERRQEQDLEGYTFERVVDDIDEEELNRLDGIYTIRTIVRWGGNRRNKSHDEEVVIRFWRKKE